VTTGSLRLRLFGLAAATIAVALGVAWLAMTVVFERHVKARLEAELANHIVWIAANLTDDGGQISLHTESPDPRMSRPFGGLYWQVEPDGSKPIRSRSLWDETLPPPPSGSVLPATYENSGPEGRMLLLRAEALSLALGDGEQRVQAIVAADYSEIEGPVGAFARDIALAMLIVGLTLATAAAVQVGVGLAPLDTIRRDVAAIRAHLASRLHPKVPSEIQPLVDEVNLLLGSQEEALTRARVHAGDLAHGLKTPLTVLSMVARDLERCGNPAAASEILAQVDAMRRRVDRELARARLGAQPHATSRLLPLIEGVIGLVRRTPQGEQLQWDIAVDPTATIAADDVDAAEAIGNILENASKWARTRVLVTTSVDEAAVIVSIDDDGPGVADDRLRELTARGAKLDEKKDGAGLGLAIVNEIVGAYRGRLELSRSELGGLRVCLAWPASPQQT
jgi:signal transduction histidine kinase